MGRVKKNNFKTGIYRINQELQHKLREQKQIHSFRC